MTQKGVTGRPRLVTVAALAGCAGLGIPDRLTGPEIAFSAFYLAFSVEEIVFSSRR